MKQQIKIFISFLFFAFLVSCTRTVFVTTKPVETDSTIVAPKIKFFNVMDYGTTYVNLNGTKVASIAKYYTSGYVEAKTGSNNITINFPNKTELLNVNPLLANNTKYSCFFYKVGNEWKYNLVKDDWSNVTLTSGFAALRILDFRTEAYYNYINVKLICPGFDIIDQKGRNFLDHLTYDSYTKFMSVGAGSYTINMYNSDTTASTRKNVVIDSKGVYSVVLMTPQNITPYQNAIYSIFPDTQKHY
jgi:hypothetical protein